MNPELIPTGPSPPFYELTKLLESIHSNGKSHKHRAQCLKQFISAWRSNCGSDVYPFVRLLLPEVDRARSNYFLKEQNLARVYCKALGLDRQTSSVARDLISWRKPKDDSDQSAGDFVTLLVEVISDRISLKTTSLTIDEINQQLDDLMNAQNEKKRLELVSNWLNLVSPNDQRWLLRIILKDLKLGLSPYNVLSLVHHQALKFYNVCSDIRLVCQTLYKSQIALPDTQAGLQVFQVLKPMLAKRSKKSLSQIVKIMLTGKVLEFIIEEKMDGERVQVHKRGDQYRYWSRNGKEYTSFYGPDPSEGCLTPWLHSAFKPEVSELILDGEMLVWDPKLGKAQAFGTLKNFRTRPSTINLSFHRVLIICMIKVFDILYIRGTNRERGYSLIDKPLSERWEAIRGGRIFEEVPSRFELGQSVKGKSSSDIKEWFEKILENKGEGLIIKKLNSRYTLNVRTDDWIKLKPDYMDELSETFDGIVLGAKWGRGRMGGKFSSFVVALVDGQTDEGRKKYKSFCNVGNGITFEETEQIMQRVEGKYFDWDLKDSNRNPVWFEMGRKSSTMFPDVWWNPEDAFLMTIKGSEILPSQAFGCKFCLRFPRSIRLDMLKSVDECLTYGEFLVIMNKPVSNKLLSKHTRVRSTKRKHEELTSSQPFPPSSSFTKSKLFNGIKFWVLQGVEDDADSKSCLEMMVKFNGGTIIRNVPQSNDLCYCIALRKDFWDAEKAIKRDLDLIHPLWVIDVVEKGDWIDPIQSKLVLFF
ncbi:ATP dependent DNA ligase domain-containing protein [Phakopsora pachyrhizi]|uniref:DNA ligase n=1 Tax=Phakopsora pachyrhizi TaxID=170000 RepID=A0AAV0AI36_PHAPC|nr:ATP dependent DNA ligase domain-containing protein [Phakopsora pachyrhizi]CAH7667372.1 ATP dependent DNA ligase domain-domain-containing protein [Phakopsora pachyrhizi]